MKRKWILGFGMLLMMTSALIGCSPQVVTQTVIVVVTATFPATQATQIMSPTAAATSSPTPPATPAVVTATLQATTQSANTASPSPSPANVPVFDYCGNHKDPNLCITSLGLSSSSTIYMIFQYTNNDKSEKYYLMFDNTKYDCAQINNLPDLYNCNGMPYAMSRTVTVQLFKVTGAVLVAQGSIYLNPSFLFTYTPTPTNTPTPTTTFTPSMTLTPSQTFTPSVTPTKSPTP